MCQVILVPVIFLCLTNQMLASYTYNTSIFLSHSWYLDVWVIKWMISSPPPFRFWIFLSLLTFLHLSWHFTTLHHGSYLIPTVTNIYRQLSTRVNIFRKQAKFLPASSRKVLKKVWWPLWRGGAYSTWPTKTQTSKFHVLLQDQAK